MRERRSRRLQRRERQHEDALGRRRAEGDPGAPQATIEQQLDGEATERVTDQDGRLGELANQRLVVVDDLGQSQPAQLLGVRPELVDVAALARPPRGGDGEAAVREVPGEVVPDDSPAP
jgi:hypothetical protein